MQAERIGDFRCEEVDKFRLVALFNGEDVRRVFDDIVFVKLFNDFAAEAFNVKSFARNKMLEALNSLCGAGEAAGTSSDGLVFFADGMGTAFRAKVRKFEFNRIRRTFFFDNLNNLRDYVTGALDYNRIANANVFAPDFVFIMQRGVRNDDTADIYRVPGRATGVRAPVRPTWMRMLLIVVMACSAGNLWAIAQRGVRVKKPSRSCRAMELTL